MEYLIKFFKETIAVLKEIWADLLFKIAGTLFPLYIGALILLLVDRNSIGKVLDPQSILLYSSTFLFSSIFLWHSISNRKNSFSRLMLLVFILFVILCSFTTFSI